MTHRFELIPFLELLENDPEFVVLYYDETQMRVNLYQGRGWNKPAVKGSNVDKRMLVGKGHGYRVAGFLSLNGGKGKVLCDKTACFIGACDSTLIKTKRKKKNRKRKSGKHESKRKKKKKRGRHEIKRKKKKKKKRGRHENKRKKKGRCESKMNKKAKTLSSKNRKHNKPNSDNHETFLKNIREGIIGQQDLTPFKTVVCVVDGARTHTTFGSHSLKPKTTMNLYKITETKPHCLKEELQRLKLWPKGGLNMKEACKVFETTITFMAQRSEFEELCEAFGCIGIYLPNSHPIFNPIERLWRAMKEEFRAEPVKSMKYLRESIFANMNNGQLDEHVKGWHHRSVRYRNFFVKHPNCLYPPTECQIRSAKYDYLDDVNVSTAALCHLLGDFDHDNFLPFSNYAHWLNTGRFGMDLEVERKLLARLNIDEAMEYLFDGNYLVLQEFKMYMSVVVFTFGK